MAIDIYDPRVMIPALVETKPVRTFLLDTYFPEVRTYRTENIDIDTQVGGRRVAAFVNRWAPGKLVDRQGFSTSSVAPPCIAIKRPITAQDVSTRVMGEHVYENRDPEMRGRMLLADDLREMNDMVKRRLEMMARDAIFTLNGNNSRITATGEDVSMTFDFARDSALNIGTLGGTAAWTHADSDPIAKIDEWCEIYARTTGFVPDDLILGATALRTFIDNTKVKAKLDLLRMQFGETNIADLPDGVRKIGTLFGRLNLWSYHEWYQDPDASGATTVMVPEKKIMLASRRLRNEQRYGAIQGLSGDGPDAMPTLIEGTVIPRSWVVMDPPTRYLELRSRPLPVPHQNYFLTAQVQA